MVHIFSDYSVLTKFYEFSKMTLFVLIRKTRLEEFETNRNNQEWTWIRTFSIFVIPIWENEIIEKKNRQKIFHSKTTKILGIGKKCVCSYRFFLGSIFMLKFRSELTSKWPFVSIIAVNKVSRGHLRSPQYLFSLFWLVNQGLMN